MPPEDDTAEYERIIAEHFAQSPPSVPAPGGETAGVEVEAPVSQPAVETPPPPSPDTPIIPSDDTWEYAEGRTINRDLAERYAAFDEYLQDNPDFAEALTGIVDGKLKVVPATEDAPARVVPTTAEIPDDLDPEDPATKFLLARITDQQSRLDAALEQINRHQSQLDLQSQSTTEALINRATRSFQSDHALTDDEMARVYEAASRVNLAALMGPTDPTTGMPRKVDPLAALETALETAYWSMPEYRQKYEDEIQARYRADQDKKQKLNSLGGSSGSVPKEPKFPTTEPERQTALLRGVAEAMFPDRTGEYS